MNRFITIAMLNFSSFGILSSSAFAKNFDFGSIPSPTELCKTNPSLSICRKTVPGGEKTFCENFPDFPQCVSDTPISEISNPPSDGSETLVGPNPPRFPDFCEIAPEDPECVRRRHFKCLEILNDGDIVFLQSFHGKDYFEKEYKNECATEIQAALHRPLDHYQPQCKRNYKNESNQCLGSNISSVPRQVIDYKFLGDESQGLTWNHKIRFAYEYTTSTFGLDGIQVKSSPAEKCLETDLDQIYFTDRKDWELGISKYGFRPETPPTTSSEFEEWNLNRIELYNQAPSFDLSNVSAELFLDVKPRKTLYKNKDPANKIVYKVNLNGTSLEQRQLYRGCQVYVHDVLSTPTPTSLLVIKGEAKSLETSIVDKGKIYTNAKNT